MHLVVVSDLHLGSAYCRSQAFLRLVAALPADSTLVLNGDVLHNPASALPAAQEHVLDRLRWESQRRPIVWLYGNHDEGYLFPAPGRISFARSLAVGRRLVITHGHAFDHLTPTLRWLKSPYKYWYRRRLRRGAAAAHLLWYAKRWTWLYSLLTRHVRRNAVRWAAAQGFAAISCGHTHYAEDVAIGGVRYINTGAWTEQPAFYLSVTSQALELQEAAY